MRSLAFAGLLVLSFEAGVCGYCVEDKVAAVYDHASVMQAIAKRQTVVFFAIDGPMRESRHRLQAIAESVPGVEKGSAHASLEAASLAIAFDPRRASRAAVQRVLEQKLRPLGLSLLVMKTMDRPAEFAAGGR